MKSFTLTLFLSLLSLTGYAADMMIVDPMFCHGSNPKPINPDGAQVSLKLTSAKSKRRNGTFADSLEVRVSYEQAGEDPNLNPNDEVSYRAPLFKDGDAIVESDIHAGTLELEFQSESSDTEIWTGTYTTQFGLFNVKCEATIVSEPSLIINLTKK